MRTLIILWLMFATGYNLCAEPRRHTSAEISNTDSSFKAYTGLYQSIQKAGTYYINVKLTKNGQLIVHCSWDNVKLTLLHLNGNNFMVQGFDWSLQFVKSKNNQISYFILHGTDRWDRVK